MPDVEISHNGSTIATMSASGTKVVETKGHWNTDDITVEYTKPTFSASYLGANPVKIATYAPVTTYLSSTDFSTWTPSTTAFVLDSGGATAGTAVLDLDKYNYCIIWTSVEVFAYNGSAIDKAKIIKQSHCIQQSIYKAPSNLANLTAKTYNSNKCTNLTSTGVIDLYGSTGTHTMSYTLNAGIYPTATAATFSNSTSDTPTMTIKTPSFRIACNASYLSTENASNIDVSNTYFKYWGELWQVDKDSAMLGMYKNIINAYNS